MGFCNPRVWEKILNCVSLDEIVKCLYIHNDDFPNGAIKNPYGFYEPHELEYPIKLLNKVVYDFGVIDWTDKTIIEKEKLDDLTKIFDFLGLAFYDSSCTFDKNCDLTFLILFDKIMNLPDLHVLKFLSPVLLFDRYREKKIINIMSRIYFLEIQDKLNIDVVISIYNLIKTIGIFISFDYNKISMLVCYNPFNGPDSGDLYDDWDLDPKIHNHPKVHPVNLYKFFEPFISNQTIRDFIANMNIDMNKQKFENLLLSYGVDKYISIFDTKNHWSYKILDREENEIMPNSNLLFQNCGVFNGELGSYDIKEYRKKIDDSKAKKLVFWNLKIYGDVFEELAQKKFENLEQIIFINCYINCDVLCVLLGESSDKEGQFGNLKKIVLNATFVKDEQYHSYINPLFFEEALKRGVELVNS